MCVRRINIQTDYHVSSYTQNLMTVIWRGYAVMIARFYETKVSRYHDFIISQHQ